MRDIILLKYILHFKSVPIKKLYKNNYKIYREPLSYYIKLFAITLVRIQPQPSYEYFKINNIMYMDLNIFEFFGASAAKFIF